MSGTPEQKNNAMHNICDINSSFEKYWTDHSIWAGPVKLITDYDPYRGLILVKFNWEIRLAHLEPGGDRVNERVRLQALAKEYHPDLVAEHHKMLVESLDYEINKAIAKERHTAAAELSGYYDPGYLNELRILEPHLVRI